MPKKILIVEDDHMLQRMWKTMLQSVLGDSMEIVSATSIEEAEIKFTEHKKNIAVIFVDGCVPGLELNTEPLVQHFRASSFDGPIIAISNFPDFRQKLIEAGCSHECDKQSVTKTVRELLDL